MVDQSPYPQHALLRLDGATLDTDRDFFLSGWVWDQHTNSCGLDTLAHLAIVLGLGNTGIDFGRIPFARSSESGCFALELTTLAARPRRDPSTARAFLLALYYRLAEANLGAFTSVAKVWSRLGKQFPQTAFEVRRKTWCRIHAPVGQYPKTDDGRPIGVIGEPRKLGPFAMPAPDRERNRFQAATSMLDIHDSGEFCPVEGCGRMKAEADLVSDRMPPRLVFEPRANDIFEGENDLDVSREYAIIAWLPKSSPDMPDRSWKRVVLFYKFKAGAELMDGNHFRLHWMDKGRLWTYDGRRNGGRAARIPQLPFPMRISLLVMEVVFKDGKYAWLTTNPDQIRGQPEPGSKFFPLSLLE